MKQTVTSCLVIAAHRAPILNAGIAEILRRYPGISVDMAVNVSPHLMADAALVVTDCKSAFAAQHGRPVLIVDAWPSECTMSALFTAGFKNYVLQDATSAELHAALSHLLAGGNYFSPGLFALVLQMHSLERPTPRENEVLALLARGHCNKRIAQQLGIQHDTVKTHMKSLMGKLGAASRTQALALAVQRGLVAIETN